MQAYKHWEKNAVALRWFWMKILFDDMHSTAKCEALFKLPFHFSLHLEPHSSLCTHHSSFSTRVWFRPGLLLTFLEAGIVSESINRHEIYFYLAIKFQWRWSLKIFFFQTLLFIFQNNQKTSSSFAKLPWMKWNYLSINFIASTDSTLDMSALLKIL